MKRRILTWPSESVWPAPHRCSLKVFSRSFLSCRFDFESRVRCDSLVTNFQHHHMLLHQSSHMHLLNSQYHLYTTMVNGVFVMAHKESPHLTLNSCCPFRDSTCTSATVYFSANAFRVLILQWTYLFWLPSMNSMWRGNSWIPNPELHTSLSDACIYEV